jgi:hypothetical protein
MWRVLGIGVLAWLIQVLISVCGYYLAEWWMHFHPPYNPDVFVSGQVLTLAQVTILPLLAIPIGLAVRIWAERIDDRSYWPDLVSAILMTPILVLPVVNNFEWEWPKTLCALVGTGLILTVIRFGLARPRHPQRDPPRDNP